MEYSDGNPHLWRGAILRLWPFAEAIRAVLPTVAIGLMRYRYRGWNGDAADAAADLRAVLDELPPVIQRVVLIGHSMGGRAVVAAGDHPRVAGVLALAPWLPDGEPLTALRAPVTFAHGTLDTITDPRATTAYADRLRASGTPVTVYSVAAETHTLLHRPTDWNTLVATLHRERPRCSTGRLHTSCRYRATPAVRAEVFNSGRDLVHRGGAPASPRRRTLPGWLNPRLRCSAGKGTADGQRPGAITPLAPQVNGQRPTGSAHHPAQPR